MGSNSSSVQQKIQQTVTTNAQQWGEIVDNLTCITSGVSFIGKNCHLNLTNKCLSNKVIEAGQIFELVASAAESALTQQSAMLAFLSFNSSNVRQALLQNITTEVSNSCDILGNTTAIVEDIRIVAENCGKSGITINNFGESNARCNLNQASNIITDADLISDTDQETGIFGSSGGSGSSGDGEVIIWVIMIVVIIVVVMGIVLLFRLKSRKSAG